MTRTSLWSKTMASEHDPTVSATVLLTSPWRPRRRPFCQDWRILGDDLATGSDHVVIEWRWTRPAPVVAPGWRMRGWALRERLDKEKDKDWPNTESKLEVAWSLGSTTRPTLSDCSTLDELGEEIDWIQDSLVGILDRYVREIAICARSKRWWNEDIKVKRHQLGRVSRFKRAGQASREAVWKAKKALRRSLQRARRECWEKFLETAEGDDIWAVPRYTKPQRSAAVPTISHCGVVAEDIAAKADMLVDISFPEPVEYEGDEGQRGPPGTAYQTIDERLVQRVCWGMSTKKSPGPDGVGPLAIRCLFDRDPQRVVALIRAHIRLGVHPDR